MLKNLSPIVRMRLFGQKKTFGGGGEGEGKESLRLYPKLHDLMILYNHEVFAGCSPEFCGQGNAVVMNF